MTPLNNWMELMTKLRKTLTLLRWIYLKNSQIVKWRRCVGQRGSGGVWSLRASGSIAPSHHVLVLTNRETLWTLIFLHFLRFQEIGLLIESLATGHWPVVTDLSLSALSSPQRYRKKKPLFFSLSIKCWVLSVGNLSTVWFLRCALETIMWPMKESEFQEFQEAWSMKQDKDQTWIR